MCYIIQNFSFRELNKASLERNIIRPHMTTIHSFCFKNNYTCVNPFFLKMINTIYKKY